MAKLVDQIICVVAWVASMLGFVFWAQGLASDKTEGSVTYGLGDGM